MPAKKTVTKSKSPLSIPIYSLAGKKSGSLDLPKELFAVKVNQRLITQASKVYLNNQSGHFSSTKTRGEVKGSTKKIWSQKGTGRARHGARTAPIFVGGGIALGPKSRKVVLELPKRMKKAALSSLLTQKAQYSEVLVVSDLDQATGKTSQLVNFCNKLGKSSLLIAVDKKLEMASRATRNLPKVKLTQVEQLNILELIKYQTLVLTKEAVGKLASKAIKEAKK